MKELYRLEQYEKKYVTDILKIEESYEEIFRYGEPINGILMSSCPNPSNNNSYHRLTYVDSENDNRQGRCVVKAYHPDGKPALIDVYSDLIDFEDIPEKLQDLSTNTLIGMNLEKKICRLSEHGWKFPEKGKYLNLILKPNRT